MKRIPLLLIVLLALSLEGFSQKYSIRGKVVDAETQDPLAFVNVIYGNPPRGTSTNIDGKFILQLSYIPDKIEISYLGYDKKILSGNEIIADKELIIPLSEKSFDLEKVVIKPGKNPANEIIQKVYRNKDKNNPENLHSFSYKSYNKMIFTLDTADYVKRKRNIPKDTVLVDSSEIRMKKLMEEQHLMVMESISKRRFLSPDNNKEEVLASKISGFKDPSLVFLATQFQSFSFYESFIQIGDYNYLNPITRNSEKKYFFHLEDTLYTASEDTVYVISYQPKKGKNFDGLKGMLHINSNGYALQKAIAEPADPPEDFSMKVQQQYELIENKIWFPTHLNTRIKFHNISAATDNKLFFLIGDGRTYIRNIKINPEISPEIFDQVELEVPDSAYSRSQDYWSSQRPMRLSSKESRTYEFMDSLGQEQNFDQKLQTFQALTTGYLPVGFLDIDYRKLFSYNQYEGFRLGFGAMTNDKISQFFSVGGYFSYGFKDKAWKYGGELLLNLHEKSESVIEFSYLKDVAETGSYSFLMDRSIGSTENFRKFLIERMDLVEKEEIAYTFRSLNYLKSRLFINRYTVKPQEQYEYTNENLVFDNNFQFTETGLQLKYAYKEKFIETPWGKISEGTDYPVLYANVTSANEFLGGEFENLRFEGRISKTFVTKGLGKTHLNLVGGTAMGDLPVFNLYNGNGSFGSRFNIQIDNSFATMELDEFYAERFVSVFFRHSFGSLLLKTDNFAPRISLVTNAGWGRIESLTAHQGIELKSFENGYYESGLLVDNILSVNFFSYGFGVYYRYGPYSYSKPADNFAYKLSLRFKF